ncbi:MAG: CHAP domain-containing protein [Clostridia bacterium]|nr:CHAP domain-containing protein [Clostridia bacterium]
MADIKVKQKSSTPIKTVNKALIQAGKLKDNLVQVKEKVNDINDVAVSTTASDSVNEYTSQKVTGSTNYIRKKGTEQVTKKGRNELIKVKDNIKNARKSFKQRGVIGKTKKQVSRARRNINYSKKTIKTADRSTKIAKKTAKESAKASQRIAKASRELARRTAQATKATIKAIVTAVKTTIAAIKGLATFIAAGGWVLIAVLVIIILLIAIIAVISKAVGEKPSYFGQPNYRIVEIAETQVGNVNGEPYWRWYGFEERVAWCACFVSWCSYQSGDLEDGKVPKFSVCEEGIKWFRDRLLFHTRNQIFEPMPGDYIFFDWKDKGTGLRDGKSDHVGIVCGFDKENRRVYTIEGNTSNSCAHRDYDSNSEDILGYGRPNYSDVVANYNYENVVAEDLENYILTMQNQSTEEGN